jgi:hypothetical protein
MIDVIDKHTVWSIHNEPMQQYVLSIAHTSNDITMAFNPAVFLDPFKVLTADEKRPALLSVADNEIIPEFVTVRDSSGEAIIFSAASASLCQSLYQAICLNKNKLWIAA